MSIFNWFNDNSSSSYTNQQYNSMLTQQYSGTCEVKCDNEINDVNMTFINSKIGGNIDITQTCSVNGQCIYNTSMDAINDAIFKAANNSNLSGPTGAVSGISINSISNTDIQDIQQTINQSISQVCSVSSTNQINNVDIFAENTDIGGNVVIDQSGNVVGSCSLTSGMQLAAYASGTIDNCSTTGKAAKKKSCGGKSGGKGSILIYVGVFIVVVIVIGLIAKFAGSKTPPGPPGGTPPGK